MKNYRKFLIPIVLVILLVLGVSRLDIQSVKNHDMADDNIVAEESDKSSDNDTSSEIKEDENSLQQDDKNDIGRSEDKTDSGDIASDEKEEGKNLKKKNTSKKDALKNGSLGESKKSKKEIGLKNKSNTRNDKSISANKNTEKKSNVSEKNTNKKSNVSEKNTNKKNTTRKNKTNKDAAKKNTSDKNTKKDNTSVSDKNSTDEKDDKNYIKCDVTIDCTILLSNMDKLNKNARKDVPDSGKLLDKTSIKIKKGSSAYDVLTAVCKLKKIAYDAEYSPIYKTSYVKGIGYLYEKMAGDMSGWLYLVDGVTPNVGSSAYKLKGGEHIEWTYTCSGRAGS